MKKILLLFISFFLFIPLVSANSIEKISMDIYLHEDGSAHVKEIWQTYSNEQTEWYKPYQNVGNSTFENFKVSLNNKEFDYVNYWNVDGTFNDKQYKNGINYTTDGIELCMGISEYGNKTYTMEYDITNFIADLTDSQMLYWTLIPKNMDPAPQNIYIKVHSFYDFPSTLDVWGYGLYGAPTYVYDGYIEMLNDTKTFTSTDYMVMLVKFPKGTFNILNNTYNYDFNYYKEMADDGSVHYDDDDSNNNNNSSSFISEILYLISQLFYILIPLFIGFAVISKRKNKRYYKSKKRVDSQAPMYRDIPCDKNIFKAYYISNLYSLIKKETDFFGAVLLNWLRKDMISIEKSEEKGLFKKEEISIKFINVVCENELEKELYDMMYDSCENGILKQNDFERYCKNHYNSFLNWFERVQNYECDTFITDGLITKVEKKSLGFIKTNEYAENDKIYEEANKLYGLKKFLIEFSRMEEKKPIEVKLWDYYLIYAQIFGLAKEVAKQFKKLYPEVIEGKNYNLDTIIILNSFSSGSISSATTAQSRARSYSSGGGGFSSGGGGGGSFGGGFGGGGSR